MSRIAVIGTGYVGLTSGACFAHLGHRVVCADVVPEKVEQLSRGEVPILEAGLPELVSSGLASGRLSFVLGAAKAVPGAEFVYLCVPTPQGEDGSADLTYIRDAATEIGPLLEPGAVVVNKSTVPVGSTRVVEEVLGRDDVSVVSNPEFLREGSAVHDCLHPDRIVVGGDDQAAAARVANLFASLGAAVLITDPASAETIKYASNAFLAAKISFVNAVANVCEAVGADVRDVLLGMGYDRRIGFEFMKPGPGYGGSCFMGDDTLLARRHGAIRLLSFAALFAAVEILGASGWEVLSWREGEPAPELLPVGLFTKRRYEGTTISVQTTMGRRITVTADHPFFVGDGKEPTAHRRLANQLTTADWLPVAQQFPMVEEPSKAALDALLRDGLRLGTDRYTKALPDAIWAAPDSHKQALLRELWDGDGSWSYVAGGPSVVLEYATVSRQLADGTLRLLGDLGIVARLKVGRTAKSTCDTYWLSIAGAHQIERSLWLLPEAEAEVVARSLATQTKRISPTGYRRLSKNAAWVRVARIERRHHEGDVYSLKVPQSGTVVTTHGLVVGQCFPKDTSALIRIAEDAGYDFGLLRGVVGVNQQQFDRVAAKVLEQVGGNLEGHAVAAWGLTFKARTDDLRMSPALEVLARLRAAGASVRAFDPAVHHGPSAASPDDPRLAGIDVCADPYAPCEGASVLVVLTEWDEFRRLDFAKVAGLMETPNLVDARNLLDPAGLRRRGFTYTGIGR